VADFALAALDGGEVSVDEAALEALISELRGPVLRPGEPGYDEARRIYNAMIDHRPAIILRCAGVADVMAGVRFAAANGLLMSVRGGGHNVGGKSVCDGGLLIDLSNMKGIHVDAERKIARAQPGLRLGEFDRETHAHGLATPSGVITDTVCQGSR